jgi:hypothetical protein
MTHDAKPMPADEAFAPKDSVYASTTPHSVWVDSVVSRLNELIRQNNWDSYGASQPSGASAVQLFNVADSVVSRLNELLRLEDNWDSYGASQPSEASAVQLFNVLHSVTTPNTPAPAIVPSPHGHFQAEWHRNGADLEVEVVTPTKILVSYSDATTAWDEELSFDVTRPDLQNGLYWLTAREKLLEKLNEECRAENTALRDELKSLSESYAVAADELASLRHQLRESRDANDYLRVANEKLIVYARPF